MHRYKITIEDTVTGLTDSYEMDNYSLENNREVIPAYSEDGTLIINLTPGLENVKILGWRGTDKPDNIS